MSDDLESQKVIFNFRVDKEGKNLIDIDFEPKFEKPTKGCESAAMAAAQHIINLYENATKDIQNANSRKIH